MEERRGASFAAARRGDWLHVSGELDLAAAVGLRDALADLADAEAPVVEVSGVLFIDNAGLHLLRRAAAECRARGHHLEVVDLTWSETPLEEAPGLGRRAA